MSAKEKLAKKNDFIQELFYGSWPLVCFANDDVKLTMLSCLHLIKYIYGSEFVFTHVQVTFTRLLLYY